MDIISQGTAISIGMLGAVVAIAVSAGIQLNRIRNLENRMTKLECDERDAVNTRNVILERLVRLETLMNEVLKAIENLTKKINE